MSRRVPAIVLLFVAACGGKVAYEPECGPGSFCEEEIGPKAADPIPLGTGTATGTTTGTKGGPISVCNQSHITIDCPTNEGYSVSSSRGKTTNAAEQHVIEMYEARSDHSVGFHPRGSVAVHVSRAGHHEIVLGSYEPVDFVITADPGAIVDKVTLTGHDHHTATVPPGTQLADQSGSGSACYDTVSCEPVLSSPYTDFAGCYRVTKIDIGDEPRPCTTPADPWTRFDFVYDRAESDCTGGDRYVHFNATYDKWVGAELCSPTRYKLFLGETKDGVFHEIGDGAGDGQDHCELANPNFTIPNEDDITSGTCKTCASKPGDTDFPGAVPVYVRNTFGTPFDLVEWPEHNIYTSRWYECGVSIGK